MELLVFLVLLLILGVASTAGLTVDSRDSADWAPTVDGWRVPKRA